MMHKQIMIVGALCIVLPQCYQRPQSQSMRVSFTDLEARHADIPVPLKHTPLTKELTENTIAYTAPIPLEELISFYQNEMERMGWNMFAELVGSQTILVFEKPFKNCAITLQVLAVGKKPVTKAVAIVSPRG